jgi:hypothetical protein
VTKKLPTFPEKPFGKQTTLFVVLFDVIVTPPTVVTTMPVYVVVPLAGTGPVPVKLPLMLTLTQLETR